MIIVRSNLFRWRLRPRAWWDWHIMTEKGKRRSSKGNQRPHMPELKWQIHSSRYCWPLFISPPMKSGRFWPGASIKRYRKEIICGRAARAVEPQSTWETSASKRQNFSWNELIAPFRSGESEDRYSACISRENNICFSFFFDVLSSTRKLFPSRNSISPHKADNIYKRSPRRYRRMKGASTYTSFALYRIL